MVMTSYPRHELAFLEETSLMRFWLLNGNMNTANIQKMNISKKNWAFNSRTWCYLTMLQHLSKQFQSDHSPEPSQTPCPRNESQQHYNAECRIHRTWHCRPQSRLDGSPSFPLWPPPSCSCSENGKCPFYYNCISWQIFSVTEIILSYGTGLLFSGTGS